MTPSQPDFMAAELDEPMLAAVTQYGQLYRSGLDEKARRPSSFVAEMSSSLTHLPFRSSL
jgi:hypothetical protein